MSPAAAKIAAENNVTEVAGTGRGGRVTKEDVVNKVSGAPAAAAPAKPAAPTLVIPAGDRTEQRVPMISNRKLAIPAGHRLRTFDAFWVALNCVEA
jgi:pyruvate/2-oxoglutarate dehydrogenase complex dihydrolipoamide acyltransferase (E2) component